MTTIVDVYEGFKRLDINAVIDRAVRDSAGTFITLNREQLMSGRGEDGRSLKSYKNYNYAALKHRMNAGAGFGNPDLFYSGKWQSGLFLTLEADDILDISSTDGKDTKLQAKYKNAVGLGGSYAQDWQDNDVYPKIIAGVEKETGLSFNY